MVDIHRIEHARIGVERLDAAVSFYVDALGLVELERTDDAVYLGCGRDDNYDVALVEGGTGIEHFAVRATDDAAVEAYERRLRGLDVPVERTDGEEPGQETGVRFALPSGIPMEVVSVTDDEYQHYEATSRSRGGQAPADVNHVLFLTPDVAADLTFLRDAVGLKVSEVVASDGEPELAFARCNAFHHDVALMSASTFGEGDGPSLHHLAFGFDSVDHLVSFVDRAVGAGGQFERGIGRHHGGNNVYAYLWTPGGNRLELCTQMATVTRVEPEVVEDYAAATVAWGPGPPESFGRGSGLVHDR